MAAGLYNQQGALLLAAPVQTAIGAGTVHLLGSPLTISPSTPLASFTAVESAFTGYTAQTMLTTPTPWADAAGGVTFSTGEVNFHGGSPLTTPGTVYGWWLQDHLGNLITAQIFNTPIPISVPGQGLPLTVFLNTFASDLVISNYP